VIRAAVLVAALGVAALAAPRADAAGMLDRVRAAGMLRCGAAERPGVAEAEEATARGVAVDLCRAVAIAVLGPTGRISFRIYDSERDFGAVRQGTDELAFLSGDDIADHALTGAILPGPVAVIDGIGIMVPETSPVHSMADLNGKTVCLMIASGAQRVLERAVAALHLDIGRIAFQEDSEMLDAYNVQRCQAVVGETTYLADMRRDGGVNRLQSRLLPPLVVDPVIAATPVADGSWGALVYWVIGALMRAGSADDGWEAAAFPVNARALGLQADWREMVLAQVGSYAEIVRRNFGALGIGAGPNAPWPSGVMVAPAVR
jgi:general L-amino acid transport system substrate-binding protein